MLRKFVTNHAVALAFVLPNLGISLIAQQILHPLIPWQAAYLIGAGIGFEFGQVVSIVTKSGFQIGKWRYNYSTKGDGVEAKGS